MKRALLVIDVQNEYFTGNLPITFPEGSLPRILAAMHAAREKKVPVIVIRHTSPRAEPSRPKNCTGPFWLRRRCGSAGL